MKTGQITGTAIMAAVIIALQAFSTGINAVTPGTIPIALVLPPIIVGAAMYGVKSGAILGLSFSAVVLCSGIFGIAPLSTTMWGISPAIMTIGTLGRGLAIGIAAAVLYNVFSKKSVYAGVLSAAIIVPFINTIIFTIVAFLLIEVLGAEGPGLTILQRATAIMISVNFLIELVFNIVISSALVTVINAVKGSR
jgi:uncharacterized membrane protein